MIANERGEPTIRITRSGRGLKIWIDGRFGRGFGTYLVRSLPDLMHRFETQADQIHDQSGDSPGSIRAADARAVGMWLRQPELARRPSRARRRVIHTTRDKSPWRLLAPHRGGWSRELVVLPWSLIAQTNS